MEIGRPSPEGRRGLCVIRIKDFDIEMNNFPELWFELE